MVDEFIQWLSAQNWKVIPAETATPIPEDVLSRYGHAIPQSWLNFAGKLAKCEDQTGNKWFLVGPDFKPAKTEDDWSWNELELMGLDAAGKDKKWAKEVTDFWDTHFPSITTTRSISRMAPSSRARNPILRNARSVSRGPSPSSSRRLSQARSSSDREPLTQA